MGFRWAVGVSYTESKNALRANVFNECLRRMSSTVNQKKHEFQLRSRNKAFGFPIT